MTASQAHPSRPYLLPLLQILTILTILLPPLPTALAGTVHKADSTCTITPSLDGSDDAPAILSAFEQCGHDGSVVFGNGTFHVESVMDTTGLRNVEVELRGTLLVGFLSFPFLSWYPLFTRLGDS